MKRIHASLLSLAFPLALASAQGLDCLPGECPIVERAAAPCPPLANASQGTRIGDGERLIGSCVTDGLPGLGAARLGMGVAGTWRVGAMLGDEVTRKWAGSEITRLRFALADVVPVTRAFVYRVDGDRNVSGEPVGEVDLSGVSMRPGWNDVALDLPVAMEEGVGYLMGFEYVQEAGSHPLVADMHPASGLGPGCGFVGCGDATGPDGWQAFEGHGNLCVQAVMRAADIVDRDIALGNLSVDRYRSVDDGELRYGFRIRSDGIAPPDSYVLSVSVDGKEVDRLCTPVGLSPSFQTIAGSLGTGTLGDGRHVLGVSVMEIDGEVPEVATEDDVLASAFTLYAGNVSRQMSLVENFTGVNCIYCPYGDDVLDQMLEDRPGEYALVALHYNVDGSDPYYVSGANNISNFARLPGYPSAAFNRYMITSGTLDVSNQMAILIGYTNVEAAASAIENVVDMYNADNPALVSVDISNDYDSDTRELSIRVSGEGVSMARELLDGDRLTVLLTEDSLVHKQAYLYTTIPDYVHNNVYRGMVSAHEWGDEMNWTGDSSYENDYVVTLDRDWNVENMSVVAFVSGPMAIETDGVWDYGPREDAFVNNANMASVVDGKSGISSPATAGKATESSRFTIDGVRVASPVRGVNIVRMSDGTSRKVVVR